MAKTGLRIGELTHLRIEDLDLLVWDRGSNHRAKPVRELLARHPRLRFEFLPPYAPELNPVEFLWSHLKWSLLANIAYQDSDELDDWVMNHLSDIGLKRDTLRNFSMPPRITRLSKGEGQ